jgi:hypothetical protein
MEYLVIMGFLTFVLIVILGLAFYYSGGIKDRIKVIQVDNFGEKIISTSESVFYHGKPSKATISIFIPEGVSEITIADDSLFVTVQLHKGVEKKAFTSEVPLQGSLTLYTGVRKIEVVAEEDAVIIGDA